jgi:hypothetical protein
VGVVGLDHEQRQALRREIDLANRRRLGIDAADLLLADLLRDGPRDAAECWAELTAAGYGRDTIARAAYRVCSIGKRGALARSGQWTLRPRRPGRSVA